MGTGRTSLGQRVADAVRRRLPRLNADNVRWLVAAGLVVLSVTLVAVLWKRFSPQLTQRGEYRLSEQSIIVTPQPEWIHPSTNVKVDAIRDGGLQNLNLLDSQAAVKIAEAFKLHAWVKRVIRVRKQAPASVVVELEYRQPVALVEVVFNDVLSYEPVDAEGILLPEDLFRHDEKQLENYLRISADYSMPTGSLGTPWGDERITGAAHIAALLQSVWREWQLERIAVENDEQEQLPTYELHTRGNSRILWGHAPSQETTNEAPALQKIMWLGEYIRRNRTFSGAEGFVDIDVRSAAGIQVNVRTAGRPLGRRRP